jgi:hypothetical protein
MELCVQYPPKSEALRSPAPSKGVYGLRRQMKEHSVEEGVRLPAVDATNLEPREELSLVHLLETLEPEQIKVGKVFVFEEITQILAGNGGAFEGLDAGGNDSHLEGLRWE